jgi:hypothetical protein
MTTPTILINGQYWDFNTISGGSVTNIPAAFFTAIGMSANDVGNSAQLPLIGATGKIITPSK